MSRRFEVLSICTAVAIAVTVAAPKVALGAGPSAAHAGSAPLTATAPAVPSPADLGIEFVTNSRTSVIVERGGKRYLVDLASHRITDVDDPPQTGAYQRVAKASRSALVANPAEGAAIFKQKCASCHGADGKGVSSIKTPDFTNPQVQAGITDQQMTDIITHGKPGTLMPAWGGKLTVQEISAVRGFLRSLGTGAQPAPAVKSRRKLYTPGDDFVFSLPTGRPVPRHALIVNFTHRFPYTPAFTGRANGGSLLGLDDLALPSFGFRYGVTDRLSVSILRSPTFIARPIELMAAYNFLDEHNGWPINAAVRVSMDGENNFSRNFTENLEGVFSRSIRSRAQLYFVPTLSLNDHRLFSPNGFLSSDIPSMPGYNSVSLGAGAAVDIRPTVALVVEVIPTVVNGRQLGILRPAYAFGIQKKIWRHSFTLGFTTSPGVTVSQRAGTRASFLNDPSADKPGGLFIGFDLSRRLF
ncbi:MAG: DUF5777 family beta-barrel protein [Terriglobia bacterium]